MHYSYDLQLSGDVIALTDTANLIYNKWNLNLTEV